MLTKVGHCLCLTLCMALLACFWFHCNGLCCWHAAWSMLVACCSLICMFLWRLAFGRVTRARSKWLTLYLSKCLQLRAKPGFVYSTKKMPNVEQFTKQVSPLLLAVMQAKSARTTLLDFLFGLRSTWCFLPIIGQCLVCIVCCFSYNPKRHDSGNWN